MRRYIFLLFVGLLSIYIIAGVILFSGNSEQSSQVRLDNNYIPQPTAVIAAVETAESSCSWVPESGAISYHYLVVNDKTGIVVQEETLPSTITKISFQSEKNGQYTCSVEAIKTCDKK